MLLHQHVAKRQESCHHARGLFVLHRSKDHAIRSRLTHGIGSCAGLTHPEDLRCSIKDRTSISFNSCCISWSSDCERSTGAFSCEQFPTRLAEFVMRLLEEEVPANIA